MCYFELSPQLSEPNAYSVTLFNSFHWDTCILLEERTSDRNIDFFFLNEVPLPLVDVKEFDEIISFKCYLDLIMSVS